MTGKIKKWKCPECGLEDSADVPFVPDYPSTHECRDCLFERDKFVEMKIKEDTFTYKQRECPWCDTIVIMPEFAIDEGLEHSATYPCPHCDEMCAFTGEWEETEVNHDNWESEGELMV